MDTDVLVAGAGPTGLMLANQLGRRGVRTLIVDRHAGPSLQTRALGVQARTLEIYSRIGIVERAFELGRRATGANMWAQGRRAARVPLGDIGRDLSPHEDERIPVARRLLSTTDRLFSIVVSDKRVAGLLRTRILTKLLALAMRTRRIQRLAFRTISQTGIRYPDSSLSENLPGLPDGAPRAGDRFPWLRLKLSANGPTEDFYDKLDDTRFTLIVFGQPAPPDGVPGLGDLLRTQVIPNDPGNDRELARAQVPRLAFYLLRPDGHIGLSGIRLETAAVTRYLSERLNLRV